LAFNVLSSLAPANTLGGVARQLPSELPRISGNLFAAQLPPLERHDIPEITRLVQELRTIASPEDPILVAASSGILNDDILRHADSSLGQPSSDPWWITAGNPRLNIVRPSQVDSRDFISLLPLLLMKYVVVASPFQHHLAVEEQDVVKVVHDAFLDEWELARDFNRLPVLFALDKGVDVFIFERKRPTSLKVAVMTLARMRSRVVPTQDWVVLDATSDSTIQETENGSYTIAVNPTDLDARLVRRFLFVNSRVDAGVVSGVIEHLAGGDKPLSVVVEAVNDQGEVIGSNTPVLVPIGRSEFSLSFASQTADYLLLTISGGPGVRNVVVTDLEVDVEAQGTMIRSHVHSSS
jgi:hypothetical protein